MLVVYAAFLADIYLLYIPNLYALNVSMVISKNQNCVQIAHIHLLNLWFEICIA